MAAVETFDHIPLGVVTSGGTTSSDTAWTVTANTAFPAASAGSVQFHVCDPAQTGELILVTTSPGGTGSGQSWTVARGADGTTAVAHAANFTIYQVVPASWLNKVQTAASVDWANAVSLGADPTGSADSTTAIQSAINTGFGYLPAGTYKITSTLTMTANQTLIGDGVGLTTITSATDTVLIRMGNRQVDSTMRNWMFLGGLTVSQTNGTQTHANVKIDGGGRGTTIHRVSTGGGKYGFELMDLDRCYFEDISANNPTTAGIFLEVGLENTYGTVTFVNCDAVLSNSSTYGFYVAANADQSSANQPDRITFINCMMFMTTSLTGCIGFYDTIGLTSANFIGCLWEQNIRQYRTDGSGSSVNFLGCTFLDSNNAATDIAYLNGSGTFTFRDCRFQQATNAFNGVSGSPSVCLEGKNNNQGNITNLFTGTFTSKMGTDTVFAGDATLALGLNNQRFDFGFINHHVGNPVKIYPSGDGAAAINFYKADGSTAVMQMNTTTKAVTTAASTLDNGAGNMTVGGNLVVTGTFSPSGTFTTTGLCAQQGGTDTSGTATASSPTFVSGTAAQVNTTQDAMLYVVNSAASTQGLEIQFGPTSGVANTLINSTAPIGGAYTLRVPKGWWVKITATVANFTFTAVTC